MEQGNATKKPHPIIPTYRVNVNREMYFQYLKCETERERRREPFYIHIRHQSTTEIIRKKGMFKSATTNSALRKFKHLLTDGKYGYLL